MEDLYNSVNRDFPNNQSMPLKDPFKLQARPMDFNVTKQEKFTDDSFKFHIATNLWETTIRWSLVEYERGISAMIWNGCSLFQLHISEG